MIKIAIKLGCFLLKRLRLQATYQILQGSQALDRPSYSHLDSPSQNHPSNSISSV